MIEYINIINGSEILLEKIELFKINNNIELYFNFDCNNTKYEIKFYTVSDLCIDNMNFPLQIEGFEIISNKNRGWENEKKYTVRDYENDTLSFNCEDYCIILKNS